MWNQRPLVISGPCSAESEEQVMASCTPLAKSGKVHLLRAGIWKPRTRPDSFEGVGEIGLLWLVNAGKSLGLPTTTEVANPDHVEKALKAGIDVLWIGARTTVNPFAVQAIADVLKGENIPVLVKNPVNPDLQLWIGAIERIKKAGISKIGAIHRGFSHYGESRYRNRPMWDIPIGLKTEFPELPLICDPSHIGGKREMVEEISQRAFDLGYSGLMIESHVTPDKALSDARQQVAPEDLVNILSKLTYRAKELSDPLVINKLEELRKQIDTLDEELVRLLASRMSIAEKIGEYKEENDIAILQLKRWREILDSRTDLAEKLDLTPHFIQAVLDQIHKESIRVQTRSRREAKRDDEVMW